jgi:hypothetical protein
MSNNERPELAAYRELEVLVRHLGDELAGFRRRALLAESRLKEIDTSDGKGQPFLSDRVAALEQENSGLRARLETATARARQMLDRVHFLRQQVQAQLPTRTDR